MKEPVTYEPLSDLEYYSNENHFSEALTEQWKAVFSRVPVLVDKDNYGKWALELNNVAPTLNMYFRPWSDIIQIKPSKYVIIMAQKKDRFTTGEASMEAVSDFIKDCLRKESSYPNAINYTSLAMVKSPDGEYIGDAAAVITLGGTFGKGKIVYVSSMLATLPRHRKKQFLEIIITKIADAVK